MRLTRIIESDTKKEKVCGLCGSNRFYISQGTKRKNMRTTVTSKIWDQKQYYIEKCANCQTREDTNIYDWRTVYINKFV